MTDAPKFEAAARSLLKKLKLPKGAVSIRQTRGLDGIRLIVADIEDGSLPKETPKKVGGYAVEYKKRKVLRAF